MVATRNGTQEGTVWRMGRRRRERLAQLDNAAAVPAPDPGGLPPKLSRQALSALKQRLTGDVVQLTDAAYQSARQLSNGAFQSWPQLIVYCEVFQDVWECLQFAQTHGLATTTRSGGHSTAGFSINDGLVIDTSRLNGIYVDPAGRRAVLGPGANWGHVNATLADYGLHMPTGVCGDVCMAGFTQGGGYGYTSRLYGMACDNLVEALVMLADGRIVRASDEVNPDLLWALRGGTGNNFGVLLQGSFRLQPLRPLWGYSLIWTGEQAPRALVALQRGYMSRGAPPELGWMGALANTGPQDALQLTMAGLYWGPREAGLKLLQPLIDDTGAQLKFDRMGSYHELNELVMGNMPPCPELAREDKQSTIIGRRLTLAEWTRVCRMAAKAPNPWGAVAFEPYGGAINAVPRDATAFVHRDADCDIFVDVFWMNEPERVQVQAYLDAFMQLLEPLSNGQSYQNYPRLSQTDYRQRYWADQFPRLLQVKRKFDPTDFFRYAQSVSPEPGQPWPVVPPGDRITVEPWSPPPIRTAPARRARG